MARVTVAMSGGVDSSVAAALLNQQGHQVRGVFMKNWSPETIQSLTDCPWEQDQADAAAVCKALGIPFRSVNFEKEYKERVVDYFLREYAVGRTPNPDIMCNKEIKFKAFLAEADRLGNDFIATGHYARVEKQAESYHLRRGADRAKDQSYFLYALDQGQLARSLFPIGHLPKARVRELAVEFGLPTAQKKDSQGICFIGHIDLKKFLVEQIGARPGETYLLADGPGLEDRIKEAEPVGRHQGAIFYTEGERARSAADTGMYRRLASGADVPPLYVVAKDTHRNLLYVSSRHDDPGLCADELLVSGWTAGEISEGTARLQIRYQEAEPVGILSAKPAEAGLTRLNLERPVWAAAGGQAAVAYDGEQVLGGGTVERAVLQ